MADKYRMTDGDVANNLIALERVDELPEVPIGRQTLMGLLREVQAARQKEAKP